MNHATLAVIVLFIVGMLLFAVISNTSTIYSQQVGTNTNTTQVPPSSPSSIHRLHAVKITFPARGQQVPSGNNTLTISGTSIANATSHCQISVLVNDVWPYQPATHTGPGGASDYSQWIFVLNSKYTTIKPGPVNKITARYTCSDNPAAISFYSVNVTGVGTTTTPVVGAARHAIGPSSTAANKNATNANANLTTIPSTNTSTNNQPAERTTHVSNPAANKNATNANANLTTIPSTNTSTNNQPAERTTHVSNQPAERTTHVSNQPAERTTHVSNQPAERTTHVSNQPAERTTHVSN